MYGLSASDHVHGVVINCSQTLNALRVLRTHGLSDSALQIIVVGCRCQVALCVQYIVGLHQCDRPAASQCLLAAQISLLSA